MEQDNAAPNIAEPEEVGPFCIGTKDYYNIVCPSEFNRTRDGERYRTDAWIWESIAIHLKNISSSKSAKIDRQLCLALAHVISSGLKGILPASWANAAGVQCGMHFREGTPKELNAIAYALSAKHGYVHDRSPVITIMTITNIDRRTWFRWKKKWFALGEAYLFQRMCDLSLYEDIGKPWADLAFRVAFDLCNEKDRRELHLAKGGWILIQPDGDEAWGFGNKNFLPPHVAGD
jgi:hypothetical protein